MHQGATIEGAMQRLNPTVALVEEKVLKLALTKES
jgi:hypothetical protein